MSQLAADVWELNKVRRQLKDAGQMLGRHVAAYPEVKSSPDYVRLLLKCQDLERQLDQLDKSVGGTLATEAFALSPDSLVRTPP